jgi:hypothetical protein
VVERLAAKWRVLLVYASSPDRNCLRRCVSAICAWAAEHG